MGAAEQRAEPAAAPSGPGVCLEVLTAPDERHGRLGVVTLDRPRRLNALTLAMIEAISGALDAWSADDAVRAVLVEGAGERGLCSGADLLEASGPGGGLAEGFLRAEYRLVARWAAFPKPVVSFMDGITMGGGVGTSAHASHRIVTERSRVAMPETRIGLCPDVGGTFLLSRAPGQLGRHLGLGSVEMTGADAITCGFADRFVPSAQLPALRAALAERPDRAHEVVAAHAQVPPPSPLAAQRAWIDTCYAAPDAAAALDRLDAHPDPAAARAAAGLRAVSPTAVAVTWAALERAARFAGVEESLELELRVLTGLSARPDAREGVRALLVDRDGAPRWSPTSLADVVPDEVEAVLGTPVAEPLFGTGSV